MVPPRLENLRTLMQTQAGRGNLLMRDGSRKQWLNDRLCRHVSSCDTLDAIVDVARSLNEELSEPLEDNVVVKRAEVVWRHAGEGKLEQWLGGAGVARTNRDEMDRLARISRANGSDAHLLLMYLRIAHSRRCERGETFAITPRAMEIGQVIPGWERKRYVRARDVLLEAELIIRVSDYRSAATGRVAAQYVLSGVTVGRGGGR
jgi:hypothetical protein